MKRLPVAVMLALTVAACAGNGKKVAEKTAGQQPVVAPSIAPVVNDADATKDVGVVSNTKLKCTALAETLTGVSTTCALIDVQGTPLPLADLTAAATWDYETTGEMKGVEVAVNLVADPSQHVQYVFKGELATVQSIADNLVVTLNSKPKPDARNRLPDVLSWPLGVALESGAPTDSGIVTPDQPAPSTVPDTDDDSVAPGDPAPTPTATPTSGPVPGPTPTATPPSGASEGPSLDVTVVAVSAANRTDGLVVELIVSETVRAKMKQLTYRIVIAGSDAPVSKAIRGGVEIAAPKAQLEIGFEYDGRKCRAATSLPDIGTTSIQTTCGG